MKRPSKPLARVKLATLGATLFWSSVQAQLTVQSPANTIGTGDQAWSYLVLEGEDYETKSNPTAEAGFSKVDNSGSVTSFLGNPVLGPDSTASKGSALFTQTAFSAHVDKVTYKVQFATPGTYYLYMRFTMFENGGNLTHYLNEDSFFLPPDFDKDPQTDWPLSDRGGYTEGCCDAGFLTILEDGVPVTHSGGDDAGHAYWEGNFHWNQLSTSQFLNAETQGEPKVRHKFVVSEAQVGTPLSFTVSYREGGVTIDQWLFSTNPDLMSQYKQGDLDRFFVKKASSVATQLPGNVVGTGDTAWSYLVLEAENYSQKLNENPLAGFTAVTPANPLTSFLGNPILGKDTKASSGGALFTQTGFAQHSDKVTYHLQFAKAGTYYAYMRFTMFENGGNLTHYLNEDSFFLPPDWGKDPQTDWPLSDRGGYTEGCCDAGFLTIREGGVPVSHSAGDDAGHAYWEGNFHWNELATSQFLNAETQGEPKMRHKFVVTEEQVGKVLDWTVSYREGGVTIDQWLFSTNPNLIDEYTQGDLDRLLVKRVPAVTVQSPDNVVGTGDKAWSFLKLEAENFASKLNPTPDAGFTRVDGGGSLKSFLGNPILGAGTTASGQGALFTQTGFAQHSDKVTYKVQFAKPGTYYAYMRFTMYENGGNLTHYLNEDSFFLPPDWGKDPQTDWPLSDRGGYTEGCCDAGFLTIREGGVPVSHSAGDDAGHAYWEGNFHWNELATSQFLNAETQGEPKVRHKFVVTEAQVGKPLEWTVSYREGGVTIDLWLFSTNPNLIDDYTQAQLDSLLLTGAPSAPPVLAVGRNATGIVISWPVSAAGFVLESSDALTPANWSAVGTAPVVVVDQNTVTLTTADAAKYYRLKKP